MTIEVLRKEMIAAMKNGDKARKGVISGLVEAVNKAAIDAKCRDNITEEMVNIIILKEQKTVQEMIDTCPKERADLLEEYTNRKKVISEFAPKFMSEDEIRQFLVKSAAELNLTFEKKSKGAIMKNIMPQLKGKADGKFVNQILEQLLL